MSVKEQMQSGDWSGMTAKEIAEELGCSVDTVYGALKQIKEETGKEVPYKKMRQKTEVNAGERNVSLKEALLADDWSDLTPTEIAETLGVNTTEVYKALYRLKKTGREVPYKKQSRGRPKKVAKAEAERASEEPPAHEENHAEDGDGERANNVRPYGETETHPSEEPPAHEENHAEDGDGERAARGRPYREAETPAENPQHETKPKPSEAGSALRGGAAERTSVRLTAGRERYEASADEVGRAECLSRARECVCGERETDYGTPEDSFTAIARLWSAYLSNACRCEIELSPIDVACMMGLLKIARIGGGRATVDSWVDLAGYAACGCEITTRRQEAGA